MFKNVVCVQCPIGCKIKVELTEDGHIKSITGNRCPRGVEYAKDEIKDPKRVVPTSIRVLNGELPLASVKTDKPIPKRFIPELVSSSNAPCKYYDRCPIKDKECLFEKPELVEVEENHKVLCLKAGR